MKRIVLTKKDGTKTKSVFVYPLSERSIKKKVRKMRWLLEKDGKIRKGWTLHVEEAVDFPELAIYPGKRNVNLERVKIAQESWKRVKE